MPDADAMIAEVDVATQERSAGILELRAADPQQRAMLDAYLSEIELAPAARVLDVATRGLRRRNGLSSWPMRLSSAEVGAHHPTADGGAADLVEAR